MIKEVEIKEGEISSMRVTLKSVRRAAWFAIMFGAGLSIGMLVKGEYQLLDVALACIISGFTAVLGGQGFKALQSKFEAGNAQN
jgi:hypothetical protein